MVQSKKLSILPLPWTHPHPLDKTFPLARGKAVHALLDLQPNYNRQKFTADRAFKISTPAYVPQHCNWSTNIAIATEKRAGRTQDRTACLPLPHGGRGWPIARRRRRSFSASIIQSSGASICAMFNPLSRSVGEMYMFGENTECAWARYTSVLMIASTGEC